MSKVINFPSSHSSLEDMLGESLAENIIAQLINDADNHSCPVIDINLYSSKLLSNYKRFSNLPNVKMIISLFTEHDVNRRSLSKSLKV